MNEYDEDSRLREAIDPRFQSFGECHENKKEELDGFSEYLSKHLSKYLESNLIETEPPINKIHFYSKGDGVYLFSSSSQKINDESDDDEAKIHNFNYKKKKYESSDSESEIEKMQASAVSADWILNHSAIYKTSDVEVNIKHSNVSTLFSYANAAKSKKQKKKNSK